MCRIDGPIPHPEPPLAGAGFLLRPFEPGDFAAARTLEEDPAASRWVPPLPAQDGAAAVAFYESCRLDGILLHLVIAEPAGGAYLGEAMLAIGEHGVGEVGCCVLPAARRRGIAAGALRVLTDWAFERLGLGRVHVFVAPENVAAVRLSERAGFRREGVLRSYWDGPGGRGDAIVLSRLPGDPIPQA